MTDSFRRAQGRSADPVIAFPRNPLTGPNISLLRDGLPPTALAVEERSARHSETEDRPPGGR
ncbi:MULTISPECIES: hypothetical protein [unclassified Streptomyces]|uniref:hypothetical protein n=1 Tax=unclassified Streptomyces TaxID=2593676 RepID=UPI00380766A7